MTPAPPTPRLLTNLGVLRAQEGRLAEAVTRTRQALSLDPDHVPAQENLARLLDLTPRESEPEPDSRP